MNKCTSSAGGPLEGPLGSNVFLGILGIRDLIPLLPLLEKAFKPRACISELPRLPAQGMDNARSLLVPEAECPRVQPPSQCHTDPRGQPETLQDHAVHGAGAGPWQLEAESPREHKDATGSALHCRSSPMEISSEEMGGLQKVLCRFAAGWRPAPSSPGLLWERQPPQTKTKSLAHGFRTGFKAASFLPAARPTGGVERPGAIKQLCKPR